MVSFAQTEEEEAVILRLGRGKMFRVRVLMLTEPLLAIRVMVCVPALGKVT
jgi:hypothetical protein